MTCKTDIESESDTVRKIKVRLGLILLISLLSVLPGISQDAGYEFYRPAQKELFDQGVNCLYRDSLGFLWIGTNQGLYQFDGYDYKAYKYDPFNDHSLCNNYVTCISEDRQGHLWAGTFNGLSRYDRNTDSFTNYLEENKDSNSVTNDQIKYFLNDKRNTFWVATNHGINRYDQQLDRFEKFPGYLPPDVKIGRSIVSLAEDNSGNIWIGTWNAGLIRFNYEKGEFTRFTHQNDNANSLRDNEVSTLAFINDSILWIGHYNQGIGEMNIRSLKVDYSLFDSSRDILKPGIRRLLSDHNSDIWITNSDNLVLFKGKSRQFQVISKPKADEGIITPHKPMFLYEDREHIIWLTTSEEGILYHHPYANNFKQYYRKLPKESPGVVQNYVKAFVEDPFGNLWIATFDNGLLKYSKDRKSYKRFRAGSNDTGKSILSNRLTHLFLDRNGRLWVATENGISVINSNTDEIENNIIKQTKEQDGLFVSFTGQTYQDRRGNYWIINQEGLDCFKPATNTWVHYNQSDLGGFSHYKFTSITEDSDGNLWFGTFNGLNRYNPESGKITQFRHNPKVHNSISNSYIQTELFTDSKGRMWVGTQDGLNQYIKETNSFINYSSLPGMLSNSITGILESDPDHLWIISNTGLSNFNVITNEMVNYGPAEGLGINSESHYKSPRGFLFFGGAHNDYFTFHTDSIKGNSLVPPVYVTNFLLSNKSLSISGEKLITPLKENIITSHAIQLKYNQNSFGFEFTALNYLLPEKNQYAYKLAGFEKNWNFVSSNRRFANYTNLKPGKYVFNVKASNNDFIWNETGDQITVIIKPPYWGNIWAYLVYSLVMISLILMARYLTIKQTKLKSSFELEHLLREREEEEHKLRISFFTNISHELRTPLTLISGPLKQIIQSSKSSPLSEEVTNYLSLINRNVKRLTELTNQLLDFRKIESGSMRLEIYQSDLVQFIREITETFVSSSRKKQLRVEFIPEMESLSAWFDPDKLDKILTNLIRNAVKFTFEGSITIRLTEISSGSSNTGRRVEISVSDTGIGISEDQIDQIFSPFHQVDRSYQRKNEGTGLGLALVKSLVQLYNGEISVSSQVGKGSCFTVRLPVDRESMPDNRIITPNELILSDNDASDEDIPDEKQEISASVPALGKSEKPLILIVEDNQDMRFYIRKILLDSFTIIEATHGREGLQMALVAIPDLIISDVMMPELSGTEMAQQLKSDERTSHIPIILLTALAGTGQKIKGLTIGADDYITKPFSEEILLLKTENLIKNRQKLKEHLIKQIGVAARQNLATGIEPNELPMENMDEKFLRKALNIIENHIEESEFGVETLAREIGMESSTLYKKMMALIDMPPGEFIRDIRLKRAVQLIGQKHLTISEISFMTGYNNPKYFTKVFRKHYGMSPTEYRAMKFGS